MGSLPVVEQKTLFHFVFAANASGNPLYEGWYAAPSVSQRPRFRRPRRAPPRSGSASAPRPPGTDNTVKPLHCLMSTKRKAPAPGGAAGKRRAADEAPETIEGGDDLLGLADDLLGAEGNDNDDAALQSVLENGDDGLGDELGDELEGEFQAGEDGCFDNELGDTGDDDDDDAGQSEIGDDAVSEADEDVVLPMDESELRTASEIDLSKLDITAAQARKIAPLLCANAELRTIRLGGGELTVSDLRDEDELEWDSEEYHDVEAIIIAEYMKTNTELQRLDLARNSITDAGAAALALALHENSSVEYLNLESNVVAEKGDCRRGQTSFSHPLSRDRPSPQPSTLACSPIAPCACLAGCRALCLAVASNSRLSYLNISHNAISSTGQQELRDVWTKAHGGSQLGLHL